MFGRHTKTPTQLLDLSKVQASQAKTRRSRRGSRRWLIGLVVAAILVVVSAFYIIHSSTGSAGKAGMQQAVSRLSKLMLLPTGETPTYGTVADASKLKGQTFFKNAANGDELLIYQNAKLSILYRGSINKIINVGPLVVGSSGSPYVTSRFAIKNGTSDPALADTLAARLKQLYPNATIVSSEKASRDYHTTIAIDLTKKNQPLDEQIADSLGVQAGQPPLGEGLPDADILVIIGSDFK